jgi:hypothetical protein
MKHYRLGSVSEVTGITETRLYAKVLSYREFYVFHRSRRMTGCTDIGAR